MIMYQIYLPKKNIIFNLFYAQKFLLGVQSWLGGLRAKGLEIFLMQEDDARGRSLSPHKVSSDIFGLVVCRRRQACFCFGSIWSPKPWTCVCEDKEIDRWVRTYMVMRPDRSDAHLAPEEEVKVEAEAREYFDSIAPKRHTKPSRSEYSAVYSDSVPPSDRDSTPELDKFRDLEAHDQVSLILLSLPRSGCSSCVCVNALAWTSETGVRGERSGGRVCGDGVLHRPQLHRKATSHGIF